MANICLQSYRFALAETVFRFEQGCRGLAPTALSPAVEAAAQRLIDLVVGLRSQDGGWPADLPQTPENLEPYVGEEVEELLAALGQLERQPAPEPTAQPQLLATLMPQLLWAIASSGYEIMRLLEGVQARLQRSGAPSVVGILRLVPVLSWQTDQGKLAVDLATQSALQGQGLLAGGTVQLTEGDLEGTLRPVGNWLTEITRQVSQRHPALQDLLAVGCLVEALSPGHDWCCGQLSLCFYLALEAAAADAPPQPPTAAFTLDDFAKAVDVLSPSLEAERGALPVEQRLMLPPEAAQGSLVCLPQPSCAHEETLAAWLTLTDEGWIQTFLRAVARDLFCQRLAALAGAAKTLPMAPLALVQAAYEAAGAVLGADGLFKQTFVHQPMLLTDLWPRLRWYWTGIHPLVMQLMGGVSVQWLHPGATWQRGTLYLQPVVALPLEGQSGWLDLATGRLLPTPPEPAPSSTILMLPTAELGHQPLPMATLTRWVEVQLEQRSHTLVSCQRPIAVDLHWLDLAQAHQQAHLNFSWQFVLQAGS
ncbi:MAG: hypothetical protein ICV62_04835 [Cyanobacteria bacterium Co-bin13]|nr:hypothetical protein [Cyanobacteria bacterium Co-bin13]